ncbi:enoyl-CoA hydratase/isomerase family protein [Aquabacter sp. CN5-332]|uniref:enoyl-CoA hydratase/isomerase family protein n=1 Tax=Aquabacter sp. CN5-332 TaxID=3156608 RepID=UPI0032B62153
MAYQNLLYSVDDRVATITFNRPDRHNAFSVALVDEIIAVVAEADADPEVRVLVVTGAGGKSFSSGYDIKESAEKPKRTTADWRARMQKDIQFTYSVWDCSKPVIAMVDGFCFAGGLEFAMCCDVRYCSEDSSFAALEARFSNGIATMMMPWLIGQRSRALIYTGDTIKADEAFRIGLVDQVFPKASLEAEVTKIAKRMSRVSLECLQWNKRSINHSFETMGLRNAIAYGAEACALMDSIGSPEAAQFDAIRREQGMGAALKWRAGQFAPYE